eukprot:6022278-Prorocentrum_lima.AAC.1
MAWVTLAVNPEASTNCASPFSSSSIIAIKRLLRYCSLQHEHIGAFDSLGRSFLLKHLVAPRAASS